MTATTSSESKQARLRVARSREMRRELGLKEARVAVWVDEKHVQLARDLMRQSVEHLRVYLEDEE